MIPSVKLNTGQKMPQLGLGTWQLEGEKCVSAVKTALELGYNHIDTAQVYENQREIARALQNVDRGKLFITSKLWFTDLKRESVQPACDQILQELEISYLDLLLIHWPQKTVPIAETLEAMNELVKQKKTRAIGVSNFTIAHLREALETKKARISVNQVEFHPLLYQKDLLEFCNQNKIVLTAYSPLGRSTIFKHRTIKSIAQEHGKTPAQVCLRWETQKNIVVIPKASSKPHLKENMQIFDWFLSKEDVQAIDSINRQKRVCNPPFAEFNRG